MPNFATKPPLPPMVAPPGAAGAPGAPSFGPKAVDNVTHATEGAPSPLQPRPVGAPAPGGPVQGPRLIDAVRHGLQQSRDGVAIGAPTPGITGPPSIPPPGAVQAKVEAIRAGRVARNAALPQPAAAEPEAAPPTMHPGQFGKFARGASLLAKSFGPGGVRHAIGFGFNAHDTEQSYNDHMFPGQARQRTLGDQRRQVATAARPPKPGPKPPRISG